ncbi:MAG: ShlB/FhaC/HecB family hemolysin secretion/activation protein, partial [Opitutaceae bacterium]
VTLGSWSLEFSGGLDYKQVTDNFVFGDTVVTPSEVPAFTPYDVAQATGRLTVGHPDAHGRWTAALSVNASPGGINERDTDRVYNALHHGAVSRYVYGTLELMRESDLPADFQLFSRGELQLSSANLVQSEQLSIGGQATVRGYDERIVSGDQGWTITEELRGPLWNWRPPFLRKLREPLATRPLVFWDCGDVGYKHPNGPLLDYPTGELESAGVGLRSNLGAHFVLSADYGWQLRRAPVPEPIRNRGDLQVTIAY